MTLMELQRLMFADVTRPRGTGTATRPASYIKRNLRLTSLERLSIYQRQYWLRLTGSLQDDFPALRAVLGSRAFGRLTSAYLREYPSCSWTLRDLGRNMEAWLRANPEYAGPRLQLSLDMVRLEWAHIEAFDAADAMPLGPEALAAINHHLVLRLQPHIRLLAVHHPVDELRIRFGMVPGYLTARAAAALRPKELFLALHRVDGDVYYRRLEAAEFALLTRIAAGRPLMEVLEGAEPYYDRLQTWFAMWAQLGWLC